ncbi:aminoacyl-tRNA hydrolase [Williamsia sp.]|uniref:aminoacyl-tRNA hydrolase n=1 Tax=Williamsia sp. TaxID=1872085 RepID=UPI002F95171C
MESEPAEEQTTFHSPDTFDGPEAVDSPEAFGQRYRRLVGYVGGHSDPDDPGQVLAMQMVLHISKADPPDRTELLTAAASAVALLCLDARSGPGGPWGPAMDNWCDARIRKIARRARGAHWDAAQDVPGITAHCGSAQARAIVPGPVSQTDRRIARLQIGGTDVEHSGGTEVDDSADNGAAHVDGVVAAVHPTLWVNPNLEMSVGKLAAQVGHASMLAVKLMDQGQAAQWFSDRCPVIVRTATGSRWEDLLSADAAGTAVAVRDAGFTEIAPGSVTVISAL